MQTFTSSAQTRSTDSLLLIRQYLLDIRKAVTVQKWEGEKQFQLISELFQKGATFDRRLADLLKTQTAENDAAQKEIIQTFRFLIQTLALYRSDMKNTGLKRPTNQDDYIYLTQKTTELSSRIQRIRDGARNR